MMLPLQEVLNKYNIHPKGAIVVGAHWAEEDNEFTKCAIDHVAYIEPCKEAFNKMIDDFDVRKYYDDGDKVAWGSLSAKVGEKVKGRYIFNYACADCEREMPMYVSHQNQGQSNSLLEPNLHLQQHPEVVFSDAEIVKVITLDKLMQQFTESGRIFSMLYMDVQGAEGLVLKGATETLKFIDIIYTEVNRGQTYAGNMEIEEMDELLSDFKRVETYWPSPNWTWGDAVYIRKTLL